MTETIQTNGHATVKSTILDGAKERFALKKGAPKDAEIKAAFQKYFAADDEVEKLQTQLTAAKAKRTAATQVVVETRGMTRVNTKTRGTGQIISRGESAWISFAKSDSEEIDV